MPSNSFLPSSFLGACFLATFIKSNDNYFIIFIKLILSVSTIYIFGVLWLGTLIGWDKPIYQLGVASFLLAELFKILIATLAIHQIKKINRLI